jgi:nitroreductase
MEMFDAVKTRLTVRSFKPDSVPAAVLGKILEAARVAPSSRNLQPWHFIVVQDRATLKEIGDIATSGKFVANAPLAIAIATDSADRPDLDSGRALQQMELVAWDEGLGTCFVGLRDERQNAKIKDLLGIPAEFDLITVLPFGYRTDDIGTSGSHKNRKALSEIAHNEKFSVPYQG